MDASEADQKIVKRPAFKQLILLADDQVHLINSTWLRLAFLIPSEALRGNFFFFHASTFWLSFCK